MHYISTNFNENKNDQDLIPKEVNNNPSSPSTFDNKNNSNTKIPVFSQQNHEDNDPPTKNSRTVFIGNLNFKITEKDLKDFFSKIGIVEYVKIPIKNGKPMGVAFVNFETPQSALEAIKIYNEKDLLGRKAYMRLASEPHKFSPIASSKKSQNQDFHFRDERRHQNRIDKYERNKRNNIDGRFSRAKNYDHISKSQYDYDYDYDYYNYYDYYEYNENYKYPNRDYDRRRFNERPIYQYQRRDVRVMYPPLQYENNNNIQCESYYISSRPRVIGPNYY